MEPREGSGHGLGDGVEDAEAGSDAEATHLRDTEDEDDGGASSADDEIQEESTEDEAKASSKKPTPKQTPNQGFQAPELDGLNPESNGSAPPSGPAASAATVDSDVPERVQKYDRFKKVDRAEYDRVNEFLRKRTYITAREWAIARLCSDFRTETGVEMTLIGENLPRLVPFMEDTYTPQAVNQARSAFVDKVRMSGSTFLYGAMSGFFTTEELDEMMYEVSETARFLLEVEGVEIGVDHETEVQDRISSAMREIQQSSRELRGEEDDEVHRCPECGHEF